MPSVYDKKVEELLNSGIRPIDIYTHPMYDISSGKPLALLSSLYVNSLELGVLTPEQYRFVARRTSQGEQLSRHHLMHILRDSLFLPKEYPSVEFVIVPVVGRLLTNSRLCPMLVEIFEDYPFLERKQICVAFSSDILFEDLDIVREELRRARELGVKIAMLEVGDEYCPVLRLVGMPIDIAVLDSYTMALLEDEERTRLAGTLISFLTSLGIKVFADGAPSPEAIARLGEYGATAYGNFTEDTLYPPYALDYDIDEPLARPAPIEPPVPEAPKEDTPTETPDAEQTPEAPAEEVAPAEEPVTEAPAEEITPAEERVAEAPDAEPATDSHSERSEESHSEPDLDGFRPEQLAVRYRHSFLSKLIQSDKELQQIYTEIKNLLLSYRGVKARMSFANETFKKAKVHISKLNVKGKSLTVELALNPENYSIQKYHFIDNSKKNPDLPMMMKVRSERSLRYCLELIEEQMRVLGLEKDDTYTAQDFTMPYETTEELAKRGLVKVIYGEGTAPADTTVADTLDQTTDSHSEPDVEQVPETPDTEPVSETPVEEPATEAPAEEVIPDTEPVSETPVEEPVTEAPAEEVTPDTEPAIDTPSEQSEESLSEPDAEQAPETEAQSLEEEPVSEVEDISQYLPEPVAYRTNITACPATPVYIGKDILLLFKGDIVLTRKIEDDAKVVFLALSRQQVLALDSKERAKLFVAIQALDDVQSAMATIRRLSEKEKLGFFDRLALSRANRKMDKNTLPYFNKLLPLTEEQYALYQCHSEIATTRVKISSASMWKSLRTLGTEGIVLDDNDTGEGR